MSTTDTLRTAETLTEAGVPDRQAAAHARAIEDAAGDLVTREHLDLKLRAELAALERRLVLWAVAVAVAVGSAAVSILVRLLG